MRLPSLAPSASIDDAAMRAGESALVRDAAWASLTGALAGGVVLTAFALTIGAGPLAIGFLSALPVVAQLAQLPGIALIERLRQRKRMAVWLITAARVLILSMALLPFVQNRQQAVVLLIAAQAGVALLGATGGCAVNSWLHHLIPRDRLGPFFARRLFWGSALGAIGALLAGQLIERVDDHHLVWAFAATFAAAGLTGFTSSWHLARAPEPKMGPRPATLEPLHHALRRPLRDTNFRRLLLFLGSWAVVSNIATPFLTVYLVRQLGYGVGVVTALAAAGQIANAAALHLWGRLSDRVTNKGVLAAALPVHFVCTALIVLPAQIDRAWLAIATLAALHIVMGMALGGVGLAVGNLGLKLAPQGEGTPYLAMIGIVTALAGGVTPLAAGAVAEWSMPRELSLVGHWRSPLEQRSVVIFDFQYLEFLFLISAVAGLYVLHRLALVHEEGLPADRQVVQLFAIEAARSVDSTSSIGSALGYLFAFRRFVVRPRDR
jgi:MFS family permease